MVPKSLSLLVWLSIYHVHSLAAVDNFTLTNFINTFSNHMLSHNFVDLSSEIRRFRAFADQLTPRNQTLDADLKFLDDLKTEADYLNDSFYKRCQTSPQQIIMSNNISRFILFAEKFVLRDSKTKEGRRIFDVVSNFYQLKATSKTGECGSTGSIQDAVNDYNKAIKLTMLRHYILISALHIYHYRSLRSKGSIEEAKNFQQQSIREIYMLRKAMDLLNKEMAESIHRFPSDLYPCDPPVFAEHATYEKFSAFMTGWVGGEEYLTEHHNCPNKCRHDKTTFHDMGSSANNKFHSSLKPKGELYNCRVAPHLNRIYLQLEPTNPDRLYHHLAYHGIESNHDLTGTYGQPKFNPTHTKIQTLTDADIRYNDVGYRKNCTVCLCQLNQRLTLSSTRGISVAPVVASYGNVVTGVRWVIRDHVLHIELQYGQLIKGKVDPSTVIWNLAPEVRDPKTTKYLDINLRSISLDDVSVSPDSVVIGAKFVVKHDMIFLSVIQKKIDVYCCVLNFEPDIEVKRYDPTIPRKEIILDQPGPSEFVFNQGGVENEILSTPGQHFVKFQLTDFKKDAAQTIVPYLDIQEIMTNPPAPLKGIGIYYKGAPGFGGFVGLKIQTASILEVKNMDYKFETELNHIHHIREFHQLIRD